MKKILFATTALIATAGMAAAEVSFGGYGRFGLDYNDLNDRTVNGISETNITSRLRLQIDMTTETDGGVAFAARYRIQAESRDNAPGTAVANGARFQASAGGFTLQVGNIAGSIDALPGLYLPTSSADTGIDGMGFISNVANTFTNTTGFFNFDGYDSSGAGANGISVQYSAGDFTGHFSYSTDNGAVAVDRIAAYVAYSFGDWTAALGIQDSDIAGEDKTVFTLTGEIGQFGLGLAYAQNADAGGAGVDVDKLRVYGSVDIGAASRVLVWVADEDSGTAAATDGTSFGLDYSLDLGGGVSFDAGFVDSSNNQTQVQAGVYFRF
jgi:outer membrane protein OmpU